MRKAPTLCAKHADPRPIPYDPHAVNPVTFALAVGPRREQAGDVLLGLWHRFALETRNARPCYDCGTGVERVNFGEGPRVSDLANLFHEKSALPGGFSSPLEALTHIAYQVGGGGDCDRWLDDCLRADGWSLHALWAMTRDRDWRHPRDCPDEQCRA